MPNRVKVNLKANIDYHTALAKIYDKSQPHFRKENREKVKKLLRELAGRTTGKRLLDLGCGTGFILELAHPYFDELYGVDITLAMLKEAEKKFTRLKVKNVHLVESVTNATPFPNNYFDVLTSYSFLHHLSALLPTLKESYRVLRKGGIFYSDLDPNYYFWQAIKSISKEKNISDLLKVDVQTVCNMLDDVSHLGKNLRKTTVKNAEIVESYEGGFREERIKKTFFQAGFRTVSLEYHWFWQEGKVLRDLSPADALYFENHLRSALPMTRSLFKYFRIQATK